MSLVIDIAVDGGGWPKDGGLEARIVEAIRLSAEAARVALAEAAEVSLLLSDDATVQKLNREWRAIDKPTNVLSFPAVDPGRLGQAPLVGDIVVAYETADREAAAEGKSLVDHTIHLVVHGFLHLLGHDHDEQRQADAMEALESRILARLGIADPYRDSVPLDEARA